MTSADVSRTWKATYPLDDEGLLTEAEGERLDSWIRSRVYDTELAPEDAFLRLMASGTIVGRVHLSGAMKTLQW